MTDLKPCPFCGGQPWLLTGAFNNNIRSVMCLDCGVQTKVYNTNEKAIAAWNTRTNTAEKPEEVQTMPEKTTENVQVIDDMTPMDAWRIISANMQQLYKRRKAESPNPDWKGYTDAEIRAEVICFKALQEMGKRENESKNKKINKKA